MNKFQPKHIIVFLLGIVPSTKVTAVCTHLLGEFFYLASLFLMKQFVLLIPLTKTVHKALQVPILFLSVLQPQKLQVRFSTIVYC